MIRFTQGFSLVELLVSLAIVSILASVVMPYAKITYTRTKEAELKYALRTLRNAIDLFHQDCRAGEVAQAQEGVSRNCYPKALEFLYDGVDSGDAEGSKKYYLRSIPQDPFVQDKDDEPVDHWEIRGYNDEPEGTWSSEDVFDVRVRHQRQALDKSYYNEW